MGDLHTRDHSIEGRKMGMRTTKIEQMVVDVYQSELFQGR